VLPQHALARNQFLPVKSALQDVAVAGDQIPVFRTSPPEPWRVINAQRLASDRTSFSPRSETNAVGFFTSASGVTVYRGDAYPPGYRGNVFIGEVAGNLVHRQVMKPAGATFTSSRGEEGVEFLSSTDNWFRPVNFVNAPDGTLHVVDMYRETIEHPWSIPDDIKDHLDLTSGRDRGRLYRLTPPGFRPGPRPRLSKANAAELVAHLETRNSWWRETAHRLLYERQDQAAILPLRALLAKREASEAAALGRLHALWSLEGLGALRDEDLSAALADAAPGVREQAIVLAERRLAKSSALRLRLAAVGGDADARVRFEAALALGMVADTSEALEGLTRIALHRDNDDWVRTAILSSALPQADRLAERLLASSELGERPQDAQLVRGLASLVGAGGDDARRLRLVEGLAKTAADSRQREALAVELLLGLQDGMKRGGKSVIELPMPPASAARKWIDTLVRTSASQALDSKQSPDARRQAVQILALGDRNVLFPAAASLLDPRQPPALQMQIVRTLAAVGTPQVPELLLRPYPSLTPGVRNEILESLFSRATWIESLIKALEAKTVAPGDIPLARRNLLTKNKDAGLRERAIAIFGHDSSASRKEVVAKYQAALALKGDVARGQKVYEKNCSTCHRAGELGKDIGPNLNTIRHRGASEVLLHILDPNREVAPDFIEYLVLLDDGRTTRGIILSETPASLTLGKADGTRETVLRGNIEALTSTRLSLMPEGLERNIDVPEMADLLAFVLPR
jgi:putative heme-binding domain-containing protein